MDGALTRVADPSAQTMKMTMNHDFERVRRLAIESMWAVRLQHRRLNSHEPEDARFVTRRVADWHFFIVALTRFRKVVCLASAIAVICSDVKKELAEFDAKLPGRQNMRDIAEHIDDYAIGAGKVRFKDPKDLEFIRLDDKEFVWMDETINADDALAAAESLFLSIGGLRKKAMTREV